MKRMRLFVLLWLTLLVIGNSAAWCGQQTDWQKGAQEALKNAMTEMALEKGDANLLVLTNAGYGQVGDLTTEKFLDLAADQTGCSVGERSLLAVHKSIMDPLWFSIFRKDTGRMVYTIWTGDQFEQQVIDADPAKVLTPDGWNAAAKGLIGPNMFSVTSISLTWTASPPWPLLLAAAFHDHFCPGVNSGYIYGEYVKEKLPLSKGDAYSFVTAPAKCAADALQVMFNTTSGKSSGFSMNMDGATMKKYAQNGATPATVAMRVNSKADRCDGLVLGIDWNQVYGAAGLKAGDLSPKGGRTNPVFWIARVKMSMALAEMPMDQLKNMVLVFKIFNGPADLNQKISGGDPYAAALQP